MSGKGSFCLTLDSRLRGNDAFFHCAGFNLTETAIVLASLGVILAGLWSVVDNVRENWRQDETVSNLTLVVQNVRDIHKRTSRTNAGDLTNDMVRQGAILTEMIKSRAAPFTAGHAWDRTAAGGTFRITASAADPAVFFLVQFSSLPESACIGLSGKITGGGPKGLVSTQINGGAILTGPVTPEVAAGLCQPNTANTLSFSYRLRAP